MSDKAMEFSRRGDEQWGKVLARFPGAAKRRLALGQPLAAERLAAIHYATRAYVSACLGHSEVLSEDAVIDGLLRARAAGTLHNYTPGGMLIPKREHALVWNHFHRTFAAAFAFMRAPAPPFYFTVEGAGYFTGRDRNCAGRIWKRDGSFLEVQLVHKTLQDYFESLAKAGFMKMPRLVELRVTPELEALDPAFFGPAADTPLHMAIEVLR